MGLMNFIHEINMNTEEFLQTRNTILMVFRYIYFVPFSMEAKSET